ncbi:hypothetical protein D3C85_1160400 [compost metagenome]
MLRRQSVAHGNDDAVGGQRDAAADAVSGVQIANDEPTAKKPHECGPQLLRIVRFEDAQGDVTTRPVDQLLGHGTHRRIARERQRRQSPAQAQFGQRVIFSAAQAHGEVGQAQERTGLTVRLMCAQHARHTDSRSLRVHRWFFLVFHCHSIRRESVYRAAAIAY